jgi:hypothetical protein
MSNDIKVTLTPNKQNEADTITFEELYNNILEEIETYEKLGMKEELMKQKLVLNINDLNGNVIQAYPTLFVGWLESDKVCVVANLEGVY